MPFILTKTDGATKNNLITVLSSGKSFKCALGST